MLVSASLPHETPSRGHTSDGVDRASEPGLHEKATSDARDKTPNCLSHGFVGPVAINHVMRERVLEIGLEDNPGLTVRGAKSMGGAKRSRARPD